MLEFSDSIGLAFSILKMLLGVKQRVRGIGITPAGGGINGMAANAEGMAEWRSASKSMRVSTVLRGIFVSGCSARNSER